MDSNRQKGSVGEDFTADFYSANGYRIVTRNWRFKKFGEIDIILTDADNDTLVICEVKLRKNKNFQYASEAVNIKKQNKIRMLTEIFLGENPIYQGKNVRFDVAEVYPNDNGFEINLLEDAF